MYYVFLIALQKKNFLGANRGRKTETLARMMKKMFL